MTHRDTVIFGSIHADINATAISNLEMTINSISDFRIETEADGPNYHPLSRTDVSDLLEFARQHANDARAVSNVQVRLYKAIPGMTCPAPIDSDAADRKAILGEVFVSFYKKHGGDKLLTDIICFIIGI